MSAATRRLTAALAVLAAVVLAGCRPSAGLPASSGQGGPGLNASGEQRSFTGEELVQAAASARTALRLGGSVLEKGQLPGQGAPPVPALWTQASPASCAPLTASSTGAAPATSAAALILAPSDGHAQHTAVGLTSLATAEEAAAQVRALAGLATACARYEAVLAGVRVPVAAAAADPSAKAATAVMVTSTALVPDPGGASPRERRVVRTLAAKGTVVAEVLLVDAGADDAAATVRSYLDMALGRLPL